VIALTFVAALATTQLWPNGSYVNDGKITIHKGANYITINDAGALAITCPDGTCSGGGGGSASQVSVDGGLINVNWLDGGQLTCFEGGTWTVTTTPPSNASTNIAQFGGTNVSTGTGVGGAGIPRVTVSSDSSLTCNAGSGNFSENLAQVNGVAVNVGTGTAGTGTQRVAVASDSSLTCNAGTNLNTSLLATAANQTTLGNQTTKINDGTTTAGVIAGTTALKTDMSSVAGTATSTAAAGVQLVGIEGRAGTSFETTAGVLDHNLKNVGNSAVSTAATGVQKVGVVGNAGGVVDGVVTAATSPANMVMVGGIFNSTQPAPTTGQSTALQLDSVGSLRVTTPDFTTSGALGSLNAAVTSTQLGVEGYASIQFPATNTLVGTLNVDCTADKGTTWSSGIGWFIAPSGAGAQATIVASSTPVNTNYGLLCARGSNGIRVRVNPYTSGTVTPTLAWNFTPGLGYESIAQSGSGSVFVTPLGGWAIDTANTKEAYLRTTNAATTDPALVVALSPNSVANGAAIAGGRGVLATDVIRTTPAAAATYSCATTAKTAVFVGTGSYSSLCGSATKTVRLQRVRTSATVATAAVYADVVLRKYSTATSGGTATALTKIPWDANSAAATATGCNLYTAAPTEGTLIGTVDGTMSFAPVTATLGTYSLPATLDYAARNDSEAITLRGTAQCVTLAFGTTTTNAPTVHVQWVWTEE
jgi:hypothetical protein